MRGTMTGFLSKIFLCACIFTGCSAKIHSMSLTRTDSLLTAMLKQDMHPEVIEAIFKAEGGPDNGTIPVPLMRFMDNDFFGEVLFGHPGQKMRMSFDTSWFDNWVPTVTCSAISIACAMRNKYDPYKSPFSKRTLIPFDIQIGLSHLSGTVYKDLVHINQVNVTGQTFAAVSQIPWVFMYSRFDGIMGMGMQKSPTTNQLMTNLLSEGTIKRRVFSFYFNRNPLSPKGGTLVFGGVERRHFKGNFTYVKVQKSDPQNWGFKLTKISVTTPERRTTEFCPSGCSAVASTGGNPIEGPPEEIEELNKAIKAKEFILGRYVVDCATIQNLPRVTFNIGGRDFVLKGADYVQKVALGSLATVCMTSFKKNYDPKDDTWYIGGAFMSKYYTTFDMDASTIGFADAQL